MKRRTKRVLLVLGIIFGAIMLFVTAISLRQEPPKVDIETPDLLVDVINVEAAPATFEVRSQGTVRPRTETVLSAEVSGAIVSISPKFIAGGVFARNEVLMRIDPTDYEVAVEKAEALISQRQIEFDGAKKLREQGYRAEAELASAAAALASAKAELVSAQRNLERTAIRLPYEGMVSSKEADLGQFVSPGTRLGVTFATDYAEVRLALTDNDLAFVDIPDSREVTQSGGADGPSVRLSAVQKGRLTTWDAQIVRSEGVVDERSRVTYVVARVSDPYKLHSEGTPLPVGTFVAASIAGTYDARLVRVPRGAVRGSDQLLVVNDDNQIEIRTVDILRADSEFAYVQAGVQPGERISTTVIAAPTNGMQVRTGDDDVAVAEEPGDAAAPADDDVAVSIGGDES